MRQLQISKQPTDPAWAAESTNALLFLQQLAAARPLGLAPAHEEQLLSFLVSVAKQYRGRGASWEALLAAGYAAVVYSLELDAVRPGEGSRYLAWRMRREMLNATALA